MSPRTRTIARRAGILLTAFAVLLILLWAVSPVFLRAALGRGMRDLRRNEGLVGAWKDVSHSGLGFELTGLEIQTPGGDPVLDVHAVRARPILGWPPAVIEIEGARITDRGLAAWSKSFAGANGSWYAKTAEAIRRNHPLLGSGRLRVTLDDVALDREEGSVGARQGVATLSIPSGSRMEISFDGDLSLGVGECGAAAHAFTRSTFTVNVRQDSLETHLEGDLGTLSPVCNDCLSGHVDSTRVVASPGWVAVLSTASTWSGPQALACRIGEPH